MRQCLNSRMASWFILKTFGWVSFAAPALVPFLYLSSGGASAAAPQSLDSLIKQFDSSACQACHGQVHEEWSKSFHARSIVQSLGSLRTYVDALEKERKLPPNKTQMLKCLDCHAPMVNNASESVIQEIVRLVKSAVDDKNEAQKKSAREKLSSLSVNCLGCHSTKGTGDPLTPPVPGVVYGSKRAAAPHPVQASPVIQSSVFCSQCHALWYAKDGEFLYCTTIFESHQNAYKGMGGTQSCQGCHMNNRGHTFPGAHDQSLVKEGLTLSMEAVGYQHLIANKYAPRAVVTVDVGNHAGHRIPDGWLWTSKVVLDVTAKTEKNPKVFSYQKVWQEIGVDLKGAQKVKAWEIKNTIDLALQPRRTHTETLAIELPDGTAAAEIEATLTYHHRPGEEFVVHRVARRVEFKK